MWVTHLNSFLNPPSPFSPFPPSMSLGYPSFITVLYSCFLLYTFYFALYLFILQVSHMRGTIQYLSTCVWFVALDIKLYLFTGNSVLTDEIFSCILRFLKKCLSKSEKKVYSSQSLHTEGDKKVTGKMM